jgi:hypothetical protein
MSFVIGLRNSGMFALPATQTNTVSLHRRMTLVAASRIVAIDLGF